MKYADITKLKAVAATGFAAFASVVLITQAPVHALDVSASATVNGQKVLDLQSSTQQQVSIIQNALNALKSMPQSAIQGGTQAIQSTLEQTMDQLQTIVSTTTTALDAAGINPSSVAASSTPASSTAASALSKLDVSSLTNQLNTIVNKPSNLTASLQVELQRRLDLANAAKDALSQVQSLTSQQIAPVTSQLTNLISQLKSMMDQAKSLASQASVSASGSASSSSVAGNVSATVPQAVIDQINALVKQVNDSYSQFAVALGQSQLVTSAGSQQQTVNQLTDLAKQLQSALTSAGSNAANSANTDGTNAAQNQLANVQQLITAMSAIIASAIGLATSMSGSTNLSQATTVFQSIFGQLTQNLSSLGSAQSTIQSLIGNLK